MLALLHNCIKIRHPESILIKDPLVVLHYAFMLRKKLKHIRDGVTMVFLIHDYKNKYGFLSWHLG